MGGRPSSAPDKDGAGEGGDRVPVKAVYGPYRDAKGWKITVHHVDAQGKSTKNSRRVASQEDGEAVKAALLELVEARKGQRIALALEEYRGALTAKGNKASSITTTLIRLKDFFVDTDRAVAMLNPSVCQGLYESLTRRKNVRTAKQLTPDTHRNMLSEAKTFLGWCVEKGLLDSNPLEPVKAVGRRSHGKEQLRVDEARVFMTKALELARAGDDGATAALVALVCGLRASEITGLQVRDLDDGGRVLVVAHGKTFAAARRASLPEVLQPLLERLTVGKLPTERLFGNHWRDWVNLQAERICTLAGLPKVTAHGLRGVCATVATDSGQIGDAVAAALGHENAGITRKSYIVPGTQLARGQRLLLTDPTKGGEPKS